MDWLSDKFFKNKKNVALTLLIPAVLLFFKSLAYDFTTLDEQWMVVKNTAFLEKWSSLGDVFIKPITELYYRPLLMASFVIDYHVAKLSPFIYHFTNLALHLLSVWILYLFLKAYSNDKRKSFIAALVFSIHPVVLQAVAWIPGRNDSLLCIFSLLSLVYLHKLTLLANAKNLALHFICFIGALLSKENAILLPLIYAAVLFFYGIKNKKLILGLCISWLIVCLLFFSIRNSVIGGLPVVEMSKPGSLIDFFLALITYWGKAVLPIRQSIMPTTGGTALITGIGVCIATLFLSYKFGFEDRRKALLGLWIFIVLLFIPTFYGAFKSGSEHYEHRMYSSMAGALLFFIQLKIKARPELVSKLIIGLLCVFFIKSFIRMGVYKDKEAFAEAGIKERPDYYLFYQQKGEFHYKKKAYKSAVDLFSKAIAIRPDKGELYSNRGSALYAQHAYNEAVADFDEAVKRSEFRMEYYLNRCFAYNKTGQVEKAYQDLLVLKKCCSDRIPANLEQEINEKMAGLKTQRAPVKK